MRISSSSLFLRGYWEAGEEERGCRDSDWTVISVVMVPKGFSLKGLKRGRRVCRLRQTLRKARQ